LVEAGKSQENWLGIVTATGSFCRPACGRKTELYMEKTIVAIASLILIACNVVLADSSAAVQKWLGAVQKMVAQGQTKVSTPNEERVKLIRDWAEKHSYSVTVTEADIGFRLEITRAIAKD
jgi:hypothetical protein